MLSVGLLLALNLLLVASYFLYLVFIISEANFIKNKLRLDMEIFALNLISSLLSGFKSVKIKAFILLLFGSLSSV